MKFRFVFFFLVLIFSYSKNSYTQNIAEKNESKIGFYFGGSYNVNSSNIPVFWKNYNFGTYGNEKSISYEFGLDYNLNALDSFLWIDFRLAYHNFPIHFARTNEANKVFNPSNNNYESLILKHTLEASLGYFLIEPAIFIRFIRTLPIYAKFGLSLGLPTFDNQFNLYSEIISPNFYYFEDNSKKQLQNNVNNAFSPMMSLMIAAMYDYEIFPNIFIGTEFYTRLPLQSNMYDYDQISNRFGINFFVNYALDFFETQVKKPHIDTIPIVKNIPEITDFKKNEIQPKVIPTIANIPTKETINDYSYTLLPYIFFDNQSSEIKPIYLNSTIDKIDKNELDLYYSILKILGAKLKETSDKIEIIGYSDGIEFDNKQDRLKLAQQRADNIANYFINQWNINSTRIQIKAYDNPNYEAKINYPEIYQDLRKVEIKVDNFSVMKPFSYTKDTIYNFKNDNIHFKINSDHPVMMTEWNLNLKIDKNSILAIKGDNFENKVTSIQLTPVIKEKIENALEKKHKIEFHLSYLTKNDKIVELIEPLRIDIIEKNNIKILNLSNYDFDNYELNKNNQKIIEDFSKNIIFKNNTIQIIGSTDNLGTNSYNNDLARKRAKTVSDYFEKLKFNIIEINVIDNNNQLIIFDNNLPEGRYLNRKVQIKINDIKN